MNFALSEEQRMLSDLVARFVEDELMPLESTVLARESDGDGGSLTDEELGPLHARCKELGLWGLDVPEELGGANLDSVSLVAVNEALRRTVVPFTFPPDSPNLHMLMTTVTDEQREQYLDPYARGEAVSAIAISEPGAGGDPAGMITRAVRDGDDWVINGRKIWVSRIRDADFSIVMAVTDPKKGSRGGITAFLVDKGTPGFEVARQIPMLAGNRTYEVVFEDCRVPHSKVLGEVGQGFAPMQLRLTVRRLQMGAWCVGLASRALDMLIEHSTQRSTFGSPLSERQAIQWWISDAATKIHACRLMAYDAAAKVDAGQDVRTEASMLKVFGTEMATEIIDNAQQAFGAMGMTKEMPLQLMAQQVRLMRIYEGPSEVHRWVVARRLIRNAGG
ncbi:MAG: acyl-CoA dehydrogenase [Chromatiales bacterium]|jgi:acyl-CoA dehydrogenase|nr:acyl-CoA dehydrogenase [Chromatiales bacterium]